MVAMTGVSYTSSSQTIGETPVKRIFCATALLVLPLVAVADFGIGASMKSNEGGVYFPISLTQRFLLEPYLQYSDREFEVSVAGSPGSGSESSFTNLSIGAGLFGTSELGDALDLYYGARLAYRRQESSSIALLISPVPVTQSLPASTSDLDGFAIAPTLGFQYFLTDRISLGAEARWEFSELSGSSINTSPSGAEIRIKETNRQNDTRTDVLLRFYFD